MISGSFFDRSVTACFMLATAALSVSSPPALAQKVDVTTDSNTMRSLAQDNSILTLQSGQKIAQEGTAAYNSGNFPLAVKKFQEARQVFNQLSNFHQELVGAFAGLDSKISASARDRALRSAQARDEATYDLARAYRASKQADLAVPLLVQVLKSQQAQRELGQKAYTELLQIGFVDLAFSGQRESEKKPGAIPTVPTPVATTTATPELALVSLAGGTNLMLDAEKAVAAGNYALAQTKLKESRNLFNQVSNFYQDLSAVFAGIDTPISNNSREKAVEAAQKRDDSTFQLALVHRALNQPEMSVPLLVQVLKSQQATRVLGKKAYAQLVELGFSDIPYKR
jgi:sorbitol-specific phosphotransferase system component IIA